MSNGQNWRSYLAILHNPCFVGHYLLDGKSGSFGTSGRVYFDGLIKDTDTSRPPTREWYRLHLIAVTREEIQMKEHLWPTDVIAWGLNIWESDLIHVQRSLMQKFACTISQNGSEGRTGGGQSIIDLSAWSLVEAAHKCMPSRFPLPLEPLYEWQMAAVSMIILRCYNNTFRALDCGYYNKVDGRSTERGDKNWEELLDCAAKNDREYGFDAAKVSHKRKTEAHGDEGPSKRSKTGEDTPSTNKRRAEDGSIDGPKAKQRVFE